MRCKPISGSVIEIECNKGYQLSDSSSTFVCLTDRIYNPPVLPTCDGKNLTIRKLHVRSGEIVRVIFSWWLTEGLTERMPWFTVTKLVQMSNQVVEIKKKKYTRTENPRPNLSY